MITKTRLKSTWSVALFTTLGAMAGCTEMSSVGEDTDETLAETAVAEAEQDVTAGDPGSDEPTRFNSSACNQLFADVPGQVLYNGNGRDVNLPAILHGKTVRLYNGKGFNQSYATVDNPSPGDIISIDRALDSDKRNTTKKWWRTDEIRSWEYCEANTNWFWRTPTMNNWHVPMRVCLRHNGALQCSNIWYADQS